MRRKLILAVAVAVAAVAGVATTAWLAGDTVGFHLRL